MFFNLFIMFLRNVLSQFFIVKCFSKSLLLPIAFDNGLLHLSQVPKTKYTSTSVIYYQFIMRSIYSARVGPSTVSLFSIEFWKRRSESIKNHYC